MQARTHTHTRDVVVSPLTLLEYLKYLPADSEDRENAKSEWTTYAHHHHYFVQLGLAVV